MPRKNLLNNTRKIIIGLLVPIVLIVFIFGIAMLYLFRSTSEERIKAVEIEQHKAITAKLRGQVDIAMTMVEQAYLNRDQDKDIEEVKADVLMRIKELRFGDDDLAYIWVHWFNPDDVEQTVMLMHPTIPSLDGADISDYRDMKRFSSFYYDGQIYPKGDPAVAHIEETNLFVDMNKTCQSAEKGGVVKYYWPKPIPGGATTAGYAKKSYVELFEPWNWVIGSGAYVDYINGIVKAEEVKARQYEKSLFLTFALSLLLSLVCGIAVSLWVARKLGILYDKLDKQLTENKQISQELEKRNSELEKAILEVKTLSGLLPICSYCKQIRDDKGYWNQMEAYIAKRSEAQFSHGICPDCLKKHYPELQVEQKD